MQYVIIASDFITAWWHCCTLERQVKSVGLAVCLIPFICICPMYNSATRDDVTSNCHLYHNIPKSCTQLVYLVDH